MSNLGALYADSDRLQDAVRLDEEALAISRQLHGDEHPITLRVMMNLADAYLETGRLDEAESICRRAIDIDRRVLGPEHPMTAATIYNLACILIKRGQKDEALALVEQSIRHGLSVADARMVAQDPDLKPLQGDPRFEALMAEVGRRGRQ